MQQALDYGNILDIPFVYSSNGDGFIEHDRTKKDGIIENIIFFGMQSNTKPFYKAADVSVICSLVEGLTLTTYEALAMGTPVVTADVGGQKELVDNKRKLFYYGQCFIMLD